MYWSVHQYHRPTMGEAIRMPSQGKPGSDNGRQRAKLSAFSRHILTSSPQPPSLPRPMAVMMNEPSKIMTAWGVAVDMMARMPPNTV